MRREFVCVRHSISKLEPITGRESETAIPRNIDGSRIGKTIRRSRYKYRKLRLSIKHQYPDYEFSKVNAVFDFLAEYHQSLNNDLNEYETGKNEEETQYPKNIMKSHKISQNVEIVKNFCTSKR